MDKRRNRLFILSALNVWSQQCYLFAMPTFSSKIQIRMISLKLIIHASSSLLLQCTYLTKPCHFCFRRLHSIRTSLTSAQNQSKNVLIVNGRLWAWKKIRYSMYNEGVLKNFKSFLITYICIARSQGKRNEPNLHV